MAGLSIDVTLEGNQEMFLDAAAVLLDLKPFLKQVGVLLMESALTRLPKVLSDNPDAVRSGRLQASIQAGVEAKDGGDTIFRLDDASVQVGSSLVYAAMVHFGGTIRPKTKKALAIPLRADLKRSGEWPMDLDPDRKILSLIPAKRGIGVLVDTENKLGLGTDPLYLLVASSTLPARPYLYIDQTDIDDIANGLWPEFLAHAQAQGGGAAPEA